MIESLADLLHPHDPLLLFDAVAAHRRLLLRTDRAERFAALLPWERLNALITPEHIVSGHVEMARNSLFLPTEMSVRRKRGNGWRERLQTAALQANCRQGLSIVVNHIQDMVRDVALMNAIVERELRSPVHTNAYVSFSRDSAFRPHWDNHNVLILQTHGRKSWRCWGQPWRFPVDKSECAVPSDPGRPEWEGMLEPGDVLYVPRGDVHAAKVIDGEDSVHLTVTITPPRAAALGLAVARLCEREAAARRDLPTVSSPEDQAAWMAEMKVLLHRAVDALDLERALADLDWDREPLAFTSLGHIDRLTPASRFQPALRRRPPAGALAGDGATIRAGDKSWRLNGREMAVLEHALRRHTLAVRDLYPLMPDMEPDAVVRLVADLATRGLLVLLPA